MAYIVEMASGSEFLGDEVGCPPADNAHGVPPVGDSVEAGLQLAQTEASNAAKEAFPAALYREALLSELED